jgi:hypothetical protein
MNTKKALRIFIAFATVVLALGLVTRVQAQSGGAVTLLDDAYATLAQADHDYKGHRVAAMKLIKLAVEDLGGKISGHGRGREPQGTSDAQLRAAEGLLQQAVTGLSGSALNHVNRAVNQINTALAIR